MVEETRMWPIVNYNPAKDPDREVTRRQFEKNLKQMGYNVSQSELDALLEGDLKATPEFIKATQSMPSDAPKSTDTEEVIADMWEEEDFRPNPALLTYREIRDKLSAVVDGDPRDPTTPLEPKPDRQSYWFDEEDDDPQTHDIDGWDTFEEDDIMSVAHGKLDELREQRHYARLAAWEMPLLSSKFSWLAWHRNVQRNAKLIN
jgi:hypothetical protein